jgi:hypothetical protein
LTLGDPNSASGFLSSIAKNQYGAALTAIGTQPAKIKAITNNWSDPHVVFSTADFAELSVMAVEAGLNNMHLVGLINENGAWVIESF